MSEASYIGLTPAEADAVRGETSEGHRLDPVGVTGGTFVLPVAVLADAAHVVHHAMLAALPTRVVGAGEWVGE